MHKEIELINLPVLPARTELDFVVSASDIALGRLPVVDNTIDARLLDISFKCMDCGFKTKKVEEMLNHQRNQKKYHTLWQRFRRWWTMK